MTVVGKYALCAVAHAPPSTYYCPLRMQELVRCARNCGGPSKNQHFMLCQSRKAKKAVCAFVVVGLGYLDYASCYIVGHNEVYKHHLKAAAIVLWLLLAVFQGSMFLYWIIVHFKGPGRVPKRPPLDIYGNDSSLLRVPDVFVCDEQGFPYWCSKCQTVKVHRLFHLGDVDYCVSKFDHYCVWIGTAIGRNNLLAFFKFLYFFDAYFILILCFVAPTTRLALARSDANIPHYVILYIFCVFWISIILSMFVVLTYSVVRNWTTLDDITVKQARAYSRYEERLRKRNGSTFLLGRVPRKESGIRYINVAHDGTRKVVAYHVQELPYNLGFQSNLINLVYGGNRSDNSTLVHFSTSKFLKAFLVFVVPYADLFIQNPNEKDTESLDINSYGDDFSPSFMDHINEKISTGNFSYASYLQQKLHANENSELSET